MIKKTHLIFPLLIFSYLTIAQSIGDFHQGGIVFYTDSSGHGLIIDTTYIDATFDWIPEEPLLSDWGVHWFSNPGAVEEFIGAGQFNTQNLAENSNPHYAANIVSSSMNGGYSDWFLPSRAELWQIMLNTNLIDSVIQVHGGDSIHSGFHWSSTQVNMSSAWALSPYSFNANTGQPAGPIENVWSKSNSALVRGVRCIDNDCSFMDSPIFGCIDPAAENFDPNAGANDFSCEYIIGCADQDACNFDVAVTLNNLDLCDYNCIGCLDPQAQNYSGVEITLDDGSCLYCEQDYQTISVSYDSIIDNRVFFQINDGALFFGHVFESNFSEGICLPQGCYNLFMFADCNITEDWLGNTFEIGDFSYTLQGEQASVDFYIGSGSCGANNLVGCMDSTAINFLLNAISDDGSCIYPLFGCTDSTACNWDFLANQDDSTCLFPIEVYLDCLGSCISDIDQDGQCDEIDFDDGMGFNELDKNATSLVLMVDVLGRVHTKHKIGSLLFYIYANGEVKKRVRHGAP